MGHRCGQRQRCHQGGHTTLSTAEPTTVRSVEGGFSLDVPAGWRWEQTGEDVSFVFHHLEGAGLVRFSEMPRATFDLSTIEGEACVLAGVPARCRASREGERRTRRWVVVHGRTVLHVSHEAPVGDDATEDARVDALLAGVHLHTRAHPVIERLLRCLAEDEAVDDVWRWSPQQPLAISAATRGIEVSLERLVRAVDVTPGRADVLLADEVRRICNLGLLGAHAPPFARVRDSVLPLIRTSVVREATDDPIRSHACTTGASDDLVCGERLLRRLFAPGLFVYYGVDVPGRFHFLSPAHCAAWGVTAAEVEAAALAHLQRLLANDRFDVVEASGGRLLVLEDGFGLAASRLLLAPVRAHLTAALGPHWRVAVPNAGTLIAFSAGVDSWLEVLGEDVWDAHLSQPIALTPQVYAFSHGEIFVPVEPS